MQLLLTDDTSNPTSIDSKHLLAMVRPTPSPGNPPPDAIVTGHNTIIDQR